MKARALETVLFTSALVRAMRRWCLAKNNNSRRLSVNNVIRLVSTEQLDGCQLWIFKVLYSPWMNVELLRERQGQYFQPDHLRAAITTNSIIIKSLQLNCTATFSLLKTWQMNHSFDNLSSQKNPKQNSLVHIIAIQLEYIVNMSCPTDLL